MERVPLGVDEFGLPILGSWSLGDVSFAVSSLHVYYYLLYHVTTINFLLSPSRR